MEVKALGVNEKIERPDRRSHPQSRDPKRNRQLLLEATLDSVAEDGIAETTVSAIIKRAGLSRGMIHLHFGGKDSLLVAAAETFSNVYYSEMNRQLARVADDPVEVIIAVIRADLSPVILNERSVAIWHEFRGEARNNPAISRFSDTRDKQLRDTVFDAFDALVKPEVRGDDPNIANEVTLGTLALLEGMWTDYMTHPEDFDRDTAVRIVCRFLNGVVPGAFLNSGTMTEPVGSFV